MNLQINNTVKADIFTAIFQNMKSFSNSINLMVEENRIFVQAMDSGHVAIAELALPADWFDKATLTSTVIGINSTILYKILSTRDKCQNIELQLQDDGMCIQFTSDNKAIFNKTFRMPLIDLDVEQMEIPEIEYQAEFSLPSATFANLINQLKLFGDAMDIECSEEKITLVSNSLECGTMSANINIDDLTAFAIEENETVKMSFSLAHLHSIAQFSKLAKEVEIKLKRNYPVQVVYNLDDTATVRFYLAPKIGDEDDE